MSDNYSTFIFLVLNNNFKAAPLCTLAEDSLMCMPENFKCVPVNQTLPA